MALAAATGAMGRIGGPLPVMMACQWGWTIRLIASLVAVIVLSGLTSIDVRPVGAFSDRGFNQAAALADSAVRDEAAWPVKPRCPGYQADRDRPGTPLGDTVMVVRDRHALH